MRLVLPAEPVAKILGVSPATLYRRAAQAGATRLGRRLILPTRLVAQWAGVTPEEAVAAVEAVERDMAAAGGGAR